MFVSLIVATAVGLCLYYMMDQSNLHTSVVIELADEEKSEDQKKYKIDLNDKDSPKNFVIDEIFCGENITVYALFEISDISNANSNKKLIEITNSVVNEEDYKFFHRNSYKNGENGRLEIGREKSIVVSEKNEANKKDIKSESLYCLGLEEGYSTETSDKTEDSNGLKVLYSKDLQRNCHKPKDFKLVSKGMNTEIAQSPRLLEEVQQAVEVKLPFVKCNREKSTTSFDEIIEIETRLSSTKPDSKNLKKPSTHFLIVPLVMMEEGLANQLKTNENNFKLRDVDINVLNQKLTETAPGKVSLGINTDLTDFNNLPQEKKIQIQEKITQTLSKSLMNIAQDLKTHQPPEEKKETILQEVKILQSKLNSLIESLELYKVQTGQSECESLEMGFSEDKNHLKNSQVLLDVIPMSSPLARVPSIRKIKNKNSWKHSSQELKNEIIVLRPKSSTIISSRSLSSVSQILITGISPSSVKETNSEVSINWENLDNWRGLGTSKSESINRKMSSDLKTPNSLLKKSLSFDIKSEKPDVLGVKKIKNLCCKLEPNNVSDKPEIRIIQEISSPLGDNLILSKNEIVDDVLKSTKNTKPEFLDFIKKEKTTDALGNSPYKSQESHKNEGDVKMSHNLINPSFIRKSEKLIVQYCTSKTKSENILKNPKISIQKGKNKNAEKVLKLGRDSTNSKTSNKKIIADSKKDTKIVSKTISKSKAGEKSSKSDRNDSHEIIKPKSILKSRKLVLNSAAESKQHVNKFVKKSEEEKPGSAEIKNGSKGEATRLPRLLSQKRDRRDTTSGESRTSSRNEIISKNNSQVKLRTTEKLKRPKAKKKMGDVLMLESNDSNEDDNSIALTSSNPSSVTVELFLKKPTSLDDFYSEADQECLFGSSALADFAPVYKKNNELCGVVSQTPEKPVVKSVWALTKVLLFEDGTKKLEILEASLTPPGCYFK